MAAEGVDDIVEYTIFGSKIGLVVRGFFDSTSPSFLIIRTSRGGPLNLKEVSMRAINLYRLTDT